MIEFSESDVATLSKLNLTALEAKIYLTLCKQGDLTALEISKLTKTARPDIYRVMRGLQEKCLVEKILERPVRMKAVPIDVGLKLLIKLKMAEVEKVKTETNQLFHRFKKAKLNSANNAIDEKFILVPKSEPIINKIRQAIDEAQESIDLILTFKRFLYGMTTIFRENVIKAWDRGVQFRFLLQEPQKGTNNEESVRICRDSGMCSLKFFSCQPKAVMGLYDRRAVFIIVNPEEDIQSSPALWSNSQSLLAIAQDYFNVLWICADNNKERIIDLVSI